MLPNGLTTTTLDAIREAYSTTNNMLLYPMPTKWHSFFGERSQNERDEIAGTSMATCLERWVETTNKGIIVSTCSGLKMWI